MLKSNTISLKIYYNITLYIQFKDTMIFIYYYVTIKKHRMPKLNHPPGFKKNFRKNRNSSRITITVNFVLFFAHCSKKYIPVQFRAKSEFVRACARNSPIYCAAQTESSPACKMLVSSRNCSLFRNSILWNSHLVP